MNEHTHDEPHADSHVHADGTSHDHPDHDHAHPHAHEHTHADGMTHSHEHSDHDHPHGKRPGFLARLFGAR